MINKNEKKLDAVKTREEILSLRKTLLNLNFQKSSGQLEKTAEIRKAKKNIAKLKFALSKLSGDTNA